ncbi:Hypothetical predicted protein [Mytilus galloprovincialis]|uniref:Tc1-like transposase DDE domain-containing protein n=1 Tax=Mytilus galloprovincialis TaxID=29158 RepID=A0A8B6H1C5_MYTGA|nr:Hypothetical predicted protein [Mytilus galloprovincialis]
MNVCTYGEKETRSGDRTLCNRGLPQHLNNQVMIWGCICWNGVGTLTPVEGNINAVKYQEILDEHLWPVIARHFPGGNYLFQDDNAPVHRARSTQEFVARNGNNRYELACTVPRLEYNRKRLVTCKKKTSNTYWDD